MPIRSSFPPLGLDYLRASLEPDNEVILLRPNAFRDVQKHLARCDIVGITSSTADYPDALETAKRVKQARPDTPVVMGGPHVTIQDVETLETGHVDVVVRGEGERIIRKLARSTPLRGDREHHLQERGEDSTVRPRSGGSAFEAYLSS